MRIHAIQTGTVAVKTSQTDGGGHRRRSFARLFADRRWTDPLPILAWLIEHPAAPSAAAAAAAAQMACAAP